MSNRQMFEALLRQQFTLQRTELAALTIAGGAIVPLSLRGASIAGPLTEAEVLLTLGMPLTILSVIFSVVTGLVLAIRAYTVDAQTRHTYALSLPITRGHYALLRAGTGLTLALIPLAAYGIGAFLTAASVPLPPELFAYPGGVTMRGALTVLMAYAFGFALQYGLGRHAGRVFIVVILLVGAVELIDQLVFRGQLTPDFWSAVVSETSPFAVFNSGWMLFDV
jgi:hypothetical protein